MFLLAVTVFMFGVQGLCLWISVCSSTSLNERFKLYDRARALVFSDPAAALVLLAALRDISFDTHFWYRLTLRDADKLYPKR